MNGNRYFFGSICPLGLCIYIFLRGLDVVPLLITLIIMITSFILYLYISVSLENNMSIREMPKPIMIIFNLCTMFGWLMLLLIVPALYLMPF